MENSEKADRPPLETQVRRPTETDSGRFAPGIGRRRSVFGAEKRLRRSERAAAVFFAVRPRVGDAAGAEASRSARSMGGKDRHFFEKIGVMPEKRKDRDK